MLCGGNSNGGRGGGGSGGESICTDGEGDRSDGGGNVVSLFYTPYVKGAGQCNFLVDLLMKAYGVILCFQINVVC